MTQATTSTEYKDALKIQIKEAYGRIVYTFVSHHKQMARIDKMNKTIKIVQIIFSAISTFGFIGTLITNNIAATWIAGIFAAILLAINLFFKDFRLSEQIAQHRKASDELWLIRERYISLLTDFPVLSEAEIAAERDKLRDDTHEIYKSSPKTDSKSYGQAQNALKNEEEQFFSTEELDKMLPQHLRSVNNESSIDA